MTPSADPPKGRKRRRAARASLWSAGLLGGLTLALAAAIYFSLGRPIEVPAWMQHRIEARIAQELPQARVTFAEIVLVVEEGWRPRIRLRDVRIKTPEGEDILRLNEFKAGFAMRPLFDGVVQPQDMSLTGVVATLQRDEDGRVSLSAGLGRATLTREAATLPQLIGQLDDVLQRPALAALREAELRSLTLQFDDRRANRSWTVDGGRLLLSREGEALTLAADLALLGGGAEVATLSANYSSQIGDTASEFGITFEDVPAEDIASQGPAFAWLEVLRAPISGSVRSGLDAAGRFVPLSATLQIGAGAIQPNPGTRPIPFQGARSYFSYDPRQRLLSFDDFSVRSAWASGEASGTATLGISDQGKLQELVGQFALRDLQANPDDVYETPVALNGVDVDFRLSLKPFRIQLGRLQISDQENTLLLDGTLAAEPEGWRLAVDGRMDALKPDRLLAFWPARVSPKARGWVAENLLAGRLSNLDLALRIGPDRSPQTYVAFDFAGAQVRFMKTMPPIDGGAGRFSLLDGRLVAAVDRGRVDADVGGAVRVAGSSFIIPDIRVKDGAPAVIRLQTEGSVTATLSLLNRPPLNALDKANLPVDGTDGTATLDGTIALPLKKGGGPETIDYHVSGTLAGVRSEVLVKDRDLSAPDISVAANDDGLTLSGAGTVDGIAFDGQFDQPLGPGAAPGSLRAQIALDQKTLDAFGVDLPQGTVSGATTANLSLNFVKEAPPAFALSSDLDGLRLSVPQLNWSKGTDRTGTLQVSGRLGARPSVDQLELTAPGLSASGSVALREGGALERVRFDRLRAGDWLDGPVDLIGQGRGQPVQVVLRGGSLDLRRTDLGGGASAGGGSGGGGGAPLQVALDRMQITDTIALTDMNGRFTTAGGLDGSFEARLNGEVPVQGRVVPRNGRTAVRLTASDAGGVLRSAGLLQQVVGGDLSLTLVPVGTGGAFDGQLDVSDVRIRNAPGIAALLNAISVVGLVNELNGDGIFFDDVEARFRLTPDLLTLTQASAVGASMGLSMDGVYGLSSKLIDMQGVISPVYLLNGIGSLFTRKGEGLIGFNYTLRGPASAPKVAVNPLSALTPAMFRDLFRRPPPIVPQVEGEPQRPAEPDNPVVREYRGR